MNPLCRIGTRGFHTGWDVRNEGKESMQCDQYLAHASF